MPVEIALNRSPLPRQIPEENTQEKDPLSLAQSMRQLTDRLRTIYPPVANAGAVPFGSVDHAFAEAAENVLGDTISRLSAEIEAAEQLILEQSQRIEYLEHLSTTDELTGVLNRRGFEAELRRVLSRARRYGEEGVLVYVDLDGFKPVNDTYGHEAGDEVLREVARQLRDSVRDTDVVARIGGDEFGVLLVQSRREDGLERVEALDAQLNNAVANWNGRIIAISASFGFQAYESDDDGAELMGRADAAMYEIKKFKEGEAKQRRA